MFRRIHNSSTGMPFLGGIFLLLLVVSNLLLWTYHIQLERYSISLVQANRILVWQVEVAVRHSEQLYSACQKIDICAEEIIPPLDFQGSARPVAEQKPAMILISLWLISQAMLLPLWFVLLTIYRKANQRYESLQFNYENLLESYRALHQRHESLMSDCKDLIETKGHHHP